jgi:hypothetical protein
MVGDFEDIMKRYPAQTLAAAAFLGFLQGHFSKGAFFAATINRIAPGSAPWASILLFLAFRTNS